MSERSQSTIRTTAREIRRDVSPARLDDRLSDVLSERPLLRHAIDLRVFGRAVLIAAVAAAVVGLLLSQRLAALVLVAGLFAAWAVLARRAYHKRRRTVPADRED